MKQIEVFRWNIASDTVPGRRTKTRYVLSREDALARDPTATELPGTRELRTIYETDEEKFGLTFRSDMQGPLR